MVEPLSTIGIQRKDGEFLDEICSCILIFKKYFSGCEAWNEIGYGINEYLR